ncbi:MAG: hypothetical protein LBG59_07005 [Candidatus Peribacteria bacterium]|jgi:hypothetical protein|nr:hypothetical protein [Candidatus Peribacteria bacterium]
MEEQLPTAGELLMGASFNPSLREDILKAKQLFAKLFDDYLNPQREMTDRERNLYEEATARLIDAQMRWVKAITFHDSETRFPTKDE